MAEQNTEKTFTQEQVNQIVTDRLNREREKLAAEARKKAFGDEWSRRGYDKELLESLEADESGRVDAAKIFTVLDQLHPVKPESKNEKPDTRPRFAAPVKSAADDADSALREAFGFKS